MGWPSPWSNQIINQLIVGGSGSGTGIFIYAGTPGPGNPPIFWASGSTTDPYGNAITPTAGVKASGQFNAGNTIINANGIFIYSGTPASNNLILSMTTAGGTDPFGTTVPQGFGTFNAAQSELISIGLNLANNLFGLVFQSTGGSPSFAPPSVSAVGNTSAGTELTINSGLGLIRPSDADAHIHVQSQLQSAITAGRILLNAGRVVLSSSGEAFWDENAGQFLFTIAGAGPFISGEGWHTVSLPGTGGFSGTVRVKKLPWNMVALDVAIQWTNTTNASFVGGSLPDATYYPTSARWFPIAHGGAQTADNDAVIEIPISGGITITTNASSGGSGTAAQSGITVTYPTN